MAHQQPNQHTTILRRALTDQQFRQQLKSDPAAALATHGVAVPDGVTVHVHEADAKTVHLVLPSLPHPKTADQMSDEELQAVAGGTGGLMQSVANSCFAGAC